MKLVVDANILFSCLIKEGKAIELFLTPFLDLYTPEFILEEFEKYKQVISEKTHRSEEDFNKIFNIIKNILSLVPQQEYEDYLDEVSSFCPDEKDIDYLVLSISFPY